MSEPESTLPSVAKTEKDLLRQKVGAVVDKETPEEDALSLEETDELIQTGQERLGLLKGLFRLVVYWLFSVIFLLGLLGFGSLIHFTLSDKVVMTYITST